MPPVAAAEWGPVCEYTDFLEMSLSHEASENTGKKRLQHKMTHSENYTHIWPLTVLKREVERKKNGLRNEIK